MNEFIVWDERFKHFIDPCEQVMITTSGSKVKGIHGGDGWIEYWKAFPYIGKTDINNKKIYADCSIAKAELEICHITVTKIGYFSKNEETCAYELKTLGNGVAVESFDFYNFDIRNIEIIDTLQENKLGLIK